MDSCPAEFSACVSAEAEISKMNLTQLGLFFLLLRICMVYAVEVDPLPSYLEDEDDEEFDEDVLSSEMEMNFDSFMERFANEYGYNNTIDLIRKKEARRLKDHVYLDYTGAGQYLESQVFQCAQQMADNLFGNAHSRSPSSMSTEKAVRRVCRSQL